MSIRRLLALLVDFYLSQIGYYFFIIVPFHSNLGPISAKVLSMVVFLAYCYVCDSGFDRRTIGKRALGIEVVLPLRKYKIYSVSHGLLRYIFFMTLPLTILYVIFLGGGQLPYDFWFESATIRTVRD